MKRLFTIILAAVISLSSANAENADMKEFRQELRIRKMEAKAANSRLDQEVSKSARNEAKRLKKEGWVVPAGVLPLDKQLDKAYKMKYEFDENLLPCFIFGSANSYGPTYDAARMQAIHNAKIELAGMIATEVTAITEATVANSQLNQEEASSIIEVLQTSKSLISQKLGHILVATECYRKNDKGYEVMVLIACTTQKAIEACEQTIKERLEGNGEYLHNELDTMWNNTLLN